MSQPHEPTPGADPAGAEQGGAGRIGGAGDAAGQTGHPSTESEPTPSAAESAEQEAATTAAFGAEPPPGYAAGPPPGAPAGHYVWVPAGNTMRGRRFGPAFGRFARNRAAQLVAAVVVGAVVGGGTVAIVENVSHPNQPSVFRPGDPFHNGFRGGFRYSDPNN